MTRKKHAAKRGRIPGAKPQAIVCLIGLMLVANYEVRAQAPALDELQEKAMKGALEKVAPSVVQIETTGGTDIIDTGPRGQPIRKGVGPTTGLIVSPDGYIISSAFNFANKPSFILVAIPNRKERLPAKVISTDHARFLTLLKVEASGLPVPVATPRKEIRVGQWSLALGRTWAAVDHPPSMSIGIISAIDRMWGRAVQTDAKVAPVNYGGPLVDIAGRVQGVLVPASPRGEDETAGYEWYDSGIGFAIPLEDIFASLPRMKENKDLRRGLLGVTPKEGDIYTTAAVVGTVLPLSPAAGAGIKAGDVITEVEREGRRNGGTDKLDNVTLKRGGMLGLLRGELPESASLKKALVPRKAVGPKPPMPPVMPPKKDETKKDPKNVEKSLFERTS